MNFAAIKEIEQASDRAIGVVAGAIVASKLSDVLRRALGDDSPYSKRVRNQLFQHEGPLGTFGAQISMVYLIGLLSEPAHNDLMTFKKVRNLFAHYAEHNTFGTDSIKGLCKNFRLIEDRVCEQVILKRENEKEKFEVSVDGVYLEKRKMMLAIRTPDDDPQSPRWRFIATAKLFCAALDIYFREPEDLALPLL